MMNRIDHVDTLVIGAGQSGLSVGFHLRNTGRRVLIVDANDRIGDNWRSHWDSLRLYSPARNDGLPGMRFPGKPWSYPTKDDLGNFLAAYAENHELPVRMGVRVTELRRDDDGFTANCDRYGEISLIHADNVVVATGTFGRKPLVPEFGANLNPEIRQLHSAQYKNPAQLQPGPVLVVGASHSGSDLAYELGQGHKVILCGRDTGQVPFTLGKISARILWPMVYFAFGHVITRKTPIGRKHMNHIRHHGAPFIRHKRADLATVGVERVFERMVGVQDGRPVLADGRLLDVANVVWCTGFEQDFGWIKLPVVGPDGWPIERFGVVESEPGLYFTGLSFQSSMRSMLVGGAGADAKYVVEHIVRHHASRPAADQQQETARNRPLATVDHAEAAVGQVSRG